MSEKLKRFLKQNWKIKNGFLLKLTDCQKNNYLPILIRYLSGWITKKTQKIA